MKHSTQRILDALFWLGYTLALWDMYETILAAQDNPYRFHHGWYGFAILAVMWIFWWFYTSKDELKELKNKVEKSIKNR